MPQRIRVISGPRVRACLSMARAIDVAADTFRRLAAGRAMVPERTHLDIAEHDNTTLVMPAYASDANMVGCKLLSLCPRNLDRSMPMIHAAVLLMDASDGRVRAMIDGVSLTALRTGAASGLATKLLARPDVETAVIFGAGVQGRTQLEGVVAARPSITRAFVFDLSPEAAREFADEMSDRLAIDVRPAEDRRALREADVVCTATGSSRPLFSPEEIARGVHINAIGSYKLTMHEMPETLVASAKLIVDDLDACLSETADLILPIRNGLMTRDDIHAELGQIVAGERPARESDEEVTLFKSVGVAIQDLAAGVAVLEEAERRDIGELVEL